jgi:hypothetical protein
MNYATMEHGPHACSQNYAQANHISYVYICSCLGWWLFWLISLCNIVIKSREILQKRIEFFQARGLVLQNTCKHMKHSDI